MDRKIKVCRKRDSDAAPPSRRIAPSYRRPAIGRANGLGGGGLAGGRAGGPTGGLKPKHGVPEPGNVRADGRAGGRVGRCLRDRKMEFKASWQGERPKSTRCQASVPPTNVLIEDGSYHPLPLLGPRRTTRHLISFITNIAPNLIV